MPPIISATSLPVVRPSVTGMHIANNKFIRKGETHRIIAGSIHYFRMHPYHWEDRLKKVKGLGCNTIQTYVPWNFHETNPGDFNFSSEWQNVEEYIKLAQKLGLDVLLRPGPYICAEWEYGGLPAWLLDPSVTGVNTLALRTNDEVYMKFVDRFWGELLPRMKPLLAENGGPIVAVQVENEYGFMPPFDYDYLRALKDIARRHLGDEVILYTTDPPFVINRGSLNGPDVYSVADFGPGYDIAQGFGAMHAMNEDGMSPPFNSEFYIGWLTHWEELIAEKGSDTMAYTLKQMLEEGDGYGSVSFYMAFGGTNFGFWAGANRGQTQAYQGDITSYDYDCPINEDGALGRSGSAAVGTKYDAIRDVVYTHLNETAPPKEPVSKAVAYGVVNFLEEASLLEALPLIAKPAVVSDIPLPMEHYHQWYGLIVYRTVVSAKHFKNSRATLTATVHDRGVVLINGNYAATLSSNSSPSVRLNVPHRWLRYPAADVTTTVDHPLHDEAYHLIDWDADEVEIDIIVENMGRDNFCKSADNKGIVGNVLLEGAKLTGWSVRPLPLDSIDAIPFRETPYGLSGLTQRLAKNLKTTAAAVEDVAEGALDIMAPREPTTGDSTEQPLLDNMPTEAYDIKGTVDLGDKAADQDASQVCENEAPRAVEPVEWKGSAGRRILKHGPAFFRGHFTIEQEALDANGVPADTHISTHDLGKGILWINGFNAGRYWATTGPQMTLYIPGPLLRPGKNEIVILEMHSVYSFTPRVVCEAVADFEGPIPNTTWAHLKLWWRKKVRSFWEMLNPLKNKLLAIYAASPFAKGGGFSQNVN